MKKLLVLALVLLTVPAFSQLKVFSGRGKATFKADSNYCNYYSTSRVQVTVTNDSTWGNIWFCANNDSANAVKLRPHVRWGRLDTVRVTPGDRKTFVVPHLKFFRVKSDTTIVPWTVELTKAP